MGISFGSEALPARFWDKVERLPDGCWVWTGSHTVTGYAQWNAPGMNRRAHRAAYEALVGPVPDGLELHHECFRRDCVNPEHLKPVTHADNCCARRRPPGDQNMPAVLAELAEVTLDLRQIEQQRDELVRDADQLGASTRAIAAAAGVAHTTIMRALRGRAPAA